MKHAKKICKKLVKDAQAVSPIIATLMLVLVAVGSAGAFYMWQTGWQSDIEGTAEGGTELQASLSIGGSSTVYEFSAIAAEYYSAAHPNYKISYQKGGSGAGVASVGMGAVDIGSASRFVKDTENAKYPDLNKDGVKDYGRDLVEHVLAWDAVVILCKGTVSGTFGTDAFATGSSVITGTADATNPSDLTLNIDNIAIALTVGDTIDAIGGKIVTAINGDTDRTIDVAYAAGGTLTYTDRVTGSAGNRAVEMIDADFDTGDATPNSGFIGTIPIITMAGGESAVTYDFSDGVDDIELIAAINDETTWFDRSDESGTEEVFCNKLLGFKENTVEEAGTTGKILFGATHSYPSNQDILAAFDGETNAWTFTSFGMATAGGYDMCNYDDITPSKDTIKGKTYEGIRPIVYITVGDPTGDVKVYIDFCMQPENNQDISTICDYVSIY